MNQLIALCEDQVLSSSTKVIEPIHPPAVWVAVFFLLHRPQPLEFRNAMWMGYERSEVSLAELKFCLRGLLVGRRFFRGCWQRSMR